MSLTICWNVSHCSVIVCGLHAWLDEHLVCFELKGYAYCQTGVVL